MNELSTKEKDVIREALRTISEPEQGSWQLEEHQCRHDQQYHERQV